MGSVLLHVNMGLRAFGMGESATGCSQLRLDVEEVGRLGFFILQAD